jgi:UDP-3-O-[3-hydroxymyristoyl] glucosamine N-acyltransferase
MLKSASRQDNVFIGKGHVLQDNVILGNSDTDQVVIGDNALIRSGSIIYSKVKIGNGFRTGHNILIRENTEIETTV